MSGWEIAILIVMAIGLGVSLSEHGKPKTGKYSFWISLFAGGINFWLMWMAGLFH